MRSLIRFLGVTAAFALASQAFAQQIQQVNWRRPAQPCCPPTVIVPVEPGKVDPKADPKMEAPPVEAPVTGVFGEQALAGSGGATTFNPAMFGDALAVKFIRSRVTPGAPGTQSFSVAQPYTGTANFKVSDNESPRPVDRIFFSFHYFDNVNLNGAVPVNGPGGPTNLQAFNVSREVIGFEKTFWGGNASFGMRLPFQQISNDIGGVQNSELGDITFTSKFALINNLDTGNVLSTGLLVTVPTGEDPVLSEIGIDNTFYIQPWLGWLLNGDRTFAMGFHSFFIPTDTDDVSYLSNDLAAGFWLYRNRYDRRIHGLVSQVEMHVLTPLDHRNTAGLLYAVDQVTVTGGLNLILGNNTSIGGGLAIPVSGPRVYDFEGIVSLNIRF